MLVKLHFLACVSQMNQRIQYQDDQIVFYIYKKPEIIDKSLHKNYEGNNSYMTFFLI